MAFDSVPGPVQTFEARVINNIIEKLHIFVFPHKFDMQMQLSLAIQEERLKMDYWREVRFCLLPMPSFSRPVQE